LMDTETGSADKDLGEEELWQLLIIELQI
jgi:hypothetical protein